ncbi:MAG: Cna B-type domain-containing protein [Solobacterium sp.]|nr:Cna B-type domain-containing protein [Solobacterium sp.]
MKKLLILLSTVCCMLAISISSIKADGVDTYTPVDIIIPFTKVWEDNDNAEGKRPDSITVKLSANNTVYETATVTAANGWKYDFIVKDTDTDHPAFDPNTLEPYSFTVEEEPIEGYTETVHKDPSIKMETLTGDENWVWIRPNSVTTFPVYTDTYPKSFIAAKKGNQLYIWTPETISVLEQKILLAMVREHPQFPHEDWEGTTYLVGFGHHAEGGFTMTAGNPGSITFDSHPSWSFWARGTYNRSTPEENAATITNKADATPTPTPTATPTSTPTATPTSTPTATPTATPTSTPTATPTSTPTATPTSTPTATPTSTPKTTPTPVPKTPVPIVPYTADKGTSPLSGLVLTAGILGFLVYHQSRKD